MNAFRLASTSDSSSDTTSDALGLILFKIMIAILQNCPCIIQRDWTFSLYHTERTKLLKTNVAAILVFLGIAFVW